MNEYRTSLRLSQLGVILAFCVLLLGAYTRLKDAGLGCPDWPGCYGSLVVADGEALNPAKAWIEMIHRYAAGLLGIVVLILGLLAWRERHQNRTAFYLASSLCVLVVWQALLGMWTVTMSLLPIVVLAHLLGGIFIFAGLGCLAMSSGIENSFRTPHSALRIPHFLRGWVLLAFVVLMIQVSLGGWTSAQYASFACPDFPVCQGQWLPELSFREAFDLFVPTVTSYEGGILDNTARVTIHFMHRLGALLNLVLVGGLVLYLICFVRDPYLKRLGKILGFLLMIQIGLGIADVLLHIPLAVSVAHTGVAALLVLVLALLQFRLVQVRS